MLRVWKNYYLTPLFERNAVYYPVVAAAALASKVLADPNHKEADDGLLRIHETVLFLKFHPKSLAHMWTSC